MDQERVTTFKEMAAAELKAAGLVVRKTETRGRGEYEEFAVITSLFRSLSSERLREYLEGLNWQLSGTRYLWADVQRSRRERYLSYEKVLRG
jgi:hypothetical protein